MPPQAPGQGQQCPFCQLVASPDQTFDVHETEHFKAWLDINPRARGHTMIVPKEHWTGMDEIGENAPELFEMVRIVMEKAKNGLDADGVSVVMNEGEAGGQNLEHFYVQVFPRFEGEENEGAPAGAVFQPLDDLDESDLDEISDSMENAQFEQYNVKNGPATDMVQGNRSRKRSSSREDSRNSRQTQQSREQSQHSASRPQQGDRQDQHPPEDAHDSQDEHADDDDDDDDEEDERRWDGNEYSWDQDGAEFK